jgi:site-specific DNA-cytosine methylase
MGEGMRVLVACEFSGAVRDAFAARGHDAWSCDVLPSETLGQHYQGDVREFLEAGWDLMIGHPPCTHLARSGARWWKGRLDEQAYALGFVMQLWRAPIERIALENPIGLLSSAWRRPDQIIQPWKFGHGEVKATCLWLRGLPKLKSTQIVAGREPRVHYAAPGEDRGKERSRTLSGIAAAMAEQWSKHASDTWSEVGESSFKAAEAVEAGGG